MPRQDWTAPAVDKVNTGDAEAKKSVRLYLQTLGYLDKSKDPDVAKAQISDAEDYTALRCMQHFYGLEKQTGKYNEETKNAMNRKRCGIPDTARIANFNSVPDKWNKSVITWKLVNSTPDLGDDAFEKAKRQIRNAFVEWKKYMANNWFEEAVGPTADIVISFASQHHGDGYPFDGPGRVLAHAFFPLISSGELAGDMHFDEDEDWTEEFVQQVALHELGHSLGLDHSNDPNSVMYPFFNGKSRLELDDIARIRALYP
ncbi:hypothetical protein BBP40_008432 [Aspergillus hancockii]|nr:hypothetical protein BBP40_008432 [Aspergillus hancockii]